MDKHKLDQIVQNHKLWLEGKSKGERANLTEAYLTEANLSGADLSDANLTRANLSGAIFSNTTYGKGVFITKAPLQILGLRYFVLILDTYMKIGCKLYSFKEWDKFSDEEISHMDGGALGFWKENKEMIFNKIKETRDEI